MSYLAGILLPYKLWTAWNTEPSILIPLGVSAFLYGWGVLNVWRRAGPGHGIGWRHCASFLGALLALIVALVSPLDALSNDLFSAHMTQHLILILVAAPLLVMSDFSMALLWAMPRQWAQAVGRHFIRPRTLSPVWQGLSHPITAWLLFAIPLWVWHTSVLYEAALKNEALHIFEHVGFLATAMLFWRVLFKHAGSKRLRSGMAIPYLFTTVLQSGILGALITFSPRPWYSDYTALVLRWGLTPLQDQQLAGMIMWIPGGAVFSLLTIAYFAAWFRALEQRNVSLPQRDTLQADYDRKD